MMLWKLTMTTMITVNYEDNTNDDDDRDADGELF